MSSFCCCRWGSGLGFRLFSSPSEPGRPGVSGDTSRGQATPGSGPRCGNIGAILAPRKKRGIREFRWTSWFCGPSKNSPTGSSSISCDSTSSSQPLGEAQMLAGGASDVLHRRAVHGPCLLLKPRSPEPGCRPRNNSRCSQGQQRPAIASSIMKSPYE